MNFFEALVGDIMIKDVMTIGQSLTVFEALEIMMREGFDQLPVIEGGRLVGMITWRDIAQKVVLQKRNSKEILVEDVMMKEPKTVRVNERAVSAFKIVVDVGTALPVASEDRLVGLFTFHDALEYYLKTARASTCTHSGGHASLRLKR